MEKNLECSSNIFQLIDEGNHEALSNYLSHNPKASLSISPGGDNILKYAYVKKQAACIDTILDHLEKNQQLVVHQRNQHERSAINNNAGAKFANYNYFIAADLNDFSITIAADSKDFLSGCYAVEISALRKNLKGFYSQLEKVKNYEQHMGFCFNPFLAAMLVMTDKERYESVQRFKKAKIKWNDKSFRLYQTWLEKGKFPRRQQIIQQLICQYQEDSNIFSIATRFVYFTLQGYFSSKSNKRNQWLGKAKKEMDSLGSDKNRSLLGENSINLKVRMHFVIASVCQANDLHKYAQQHYQKACNERYQDPDVYIKNKQLPVHQLELLEIVRLNKLYIDNVYRDTKNPLQNIAQNNQNYYLVKLVQKQAVLENTILPIQSMILLAMPYLYAAFDMLDSGLKHNDIEKLLRNVITICKQSMDPQKEYFVNYHTALASAYAGLGCLDYKKKDDKSAIKNITQAIDCLSKISLFGHNAMTASGGFLLLRSYFLLSTLCFKVDGKSTQLDYYVVLFNHLLPQLLNNIQADSINKTLKKGRELFYIITTKTMLARLYVRWQSQQPALKRFDEALKESYSIPLNEDANKQMIGFMPEKYNNIETIRAVRNLAEHYFNYIEIVEKNDPALAYSSRLNLHKLKSSKTIESWNLFSQADITFKVDSFEGGEIRELNNIIKKNHSKIKKYKQNSNVIIVQRATYKDRSLVDDLFAVFYKKTEELGKEGLLCSARSHDNVVYMSFYNGTQRNGSYEILDKYKRSGFTVTKLDVDRKTSVKIEINSSKKKIKTETLGIIFSKLEKAIDLYKPQRRVSNEAQMCFVFHEGEPKKKKKSNKKRNNKSNQSVDKNFRQSSLYKRSKKPNKKKSIEQAPIEQTPVEQKPVEQKPVEQKPVEQKLVEQKPVEQKSEDNQDHANHATSPAHKHTDYIVLFPAIDLSIASIEMLRKIKSNELNNPLAFIGRDHEFSEKMLACHWYVIHLFEGMYLHSRFNYPISEQQMDNTVLGQLRMAVRNSYLLNLADTNQLITYLNFIEDLIKDFGQQYLHLTKDHLYTLSHFSNLLSTDFVKIARCLPKNVNYYEHALQHSKQLVQYNNQSNTSSFIAIGIIRCCFLLSCLEHLPKRQMVILKQRYPECVLFKREYTDRVFGMNSKIFNGTLTPCFAELTEDYLMNVLKYIDGINASLEKMKPPSMNDSQSHMLWGGNSVEKADTQNNYTENNNYSEYKPT